MTNIEIVSGDFSPVFTTTLSPPDSPTLELSPEFEYEHVHFNHHLAKGCCSNATFYK
jgi:hypothetical protein